MNTDSIALEEIQHLRWRLQQTEQRAERAERKQNELQETLSKVLPPSHGLYGGPLVIVQAFYEDGSELKEIRPLSKEMRISSENIEEARRVLGENQLNKQYRAIRSEEI